MYSLLSCPCDYLVYSVVLYLIVHLIEFKLYNIFGSNVRNFVLVLR